MARVLARTVVLEDSKGERVVLQPGKPVPSWAIGRIRNPAAWADEPAAGAELPAAPAAPPAPVATTPVPDVPSRTELDSDVDEPGDDPDDVEPRQDWLGRPDADRFDEPDAVEPAPEPPVRLNPPPKGGRGSSAEAWRRYAEANEIEVPARMERDEIIDLLDKRGVRTE